MSNAAIDYLRKKQAGHASLDEVDLILAQNADNPRSNYNNLLYCRPAPLVLMDTTVNIAPRRHDHFVLKDTQENEANEGGRANLRLFHKRARRSSQLVIGPSKERLTADADLNTEQGMLLW